MQTPSSRSILASGVVVFLATLAAVVFLQVRGLPTSDVLQLAGPVIGALLVTGYVNRVTTDQNRSIAKIEQQTNGVLDGRIETGSAKAVETVLKRHGIIQE